MELIKIFKSKIFWGLVLFATVFFVFAFCISDLWFKSDDLGAIINGLIKSWKDFFRVFSQDCRFFITPQNYKFSKPNFISALYRPLHHIFFSIVYFFFGFNAYYFYLLNVLFHAFNTVLIFYVFSFWLTLDLSFLGSLMFAFYRDVSWLAWISVLHNLLATFFMLLAILLYFPALKEERSFSVKYYLSGFCLFLSLLARENGVFFVFCAFVAVYLFFTKENFTFWEKLKYSFYKTWIFFLANFIYVLMRIYIFGFTTLTRTLNNVFLRFPFLNKIKTPVLDSKVCAQNVSTNLIDKTSIAHVSADTVRSSFWEKIIHFFNSKLDTFWNWVGHLFNINVSSFENKIIASFVVLFFAFFIFYSYRKNKKVLFLLFWCFLLFVWQSIVAYPNSRYLDSVYPIIIFTLFLGISFFVKESASSLLKKIILFCLVGLIIGSIWSGINKNICGIRGARETSFREKEKYAKFFRENYFDQNTNFVVISAPFESDIQNIFQYFLNDLNLKLSFELMSTLAQQGGMGCRGDYRISGVKSKIEPVKVDGKFGLHLISLDKDHCAWWMDFSFFPMRWSQEEKAYVWFSKKPEVGVWTDCSIGKFLIKERLEDKYITDIIFVFDLQWIDQNTVVVTWDTFEGKYKVLGKAQELLRSVQ